MRCWKTAWMLLFVDLVGVYAVHQWRECGQLRARIYRWRGSCACQFRKNCIRFLVLYILLSVRFRTISQDDLNLFEIPELSDDVSNKNDEIRKYPPHKCKCKCAVHHPSQQQSEQVQHAQGHAQQAFVQRQPSIVEENRDAAKMPEAIVITPASPDDKLDTNDLKNTIQKLENVSIAEWLSFANISYAPNDSTMWHVDICLCQHHHSDLCTF